MLKRDGKVYTQIVKNCSANELIPILSEFSELDSIGIGVVHLLAGGFNRSGNPLKELFVGSCIGIVELQDLIGELP